LSSDGPHDWTKRNRTAVETLRAGRLVAFPTDTVYGLGADPFSDSAITALYAAKGRHEEKPLALLLSDAGDVSRLALDVSAATQRLMERFWPGPLTLVLPASPSLPELLRAGRPTVGVRMPDHSVALALLKAFGGPLAVTSANRSGEPDCLTADEVEAALGDAVAVLLDGGRSPGGAPSTVADLSGPALRILREGPVSRHQLEEALDQTE
jgi:L-threonylcarbamoyladenylate synthase